MLGARTTSGRESFTPPACVIYPSHHHVPLATFLRKREENKKLLSDTFEVSVWLWYMPPAFLYVFYSAESDIRLYLGHTTSEN